MTDNDAMRDEIARLRAAADDLERRLRDGSGVWTTELQSSGAKHGFDRSTRRLRWYIFCKLCEQPNKLAVRYPGKAPSICDDCVSQRKNTNSARAALNRKREKRRNDGLPEDDLTNYHEPYYDDEYAALPLADLLRELGAAYLEQRGYHWIYKDAKVTRRDGGIFLEPMAHFLSDEQTARRYLIDYLATGAPNHAMRRQR